MTRRPAGALEGVRIADFGRVLAAPYATMLLADLGAEVVKVERPGGGDETRTWGPPWHGEGEDRVATYFMAVNRGKQSLEIDLATQDGREEARSLVAGCDVVVENFRAGTMDRLGLGYDALAAEHPGLVYCSVTGFGAGAGADLPGYDLVVQALGGLMSVTGDPGTGPVKVGVALVDVLAGLHATVGIQAALRHRDRTGEGQRVEVDLLSSLLSGLVNQASAHLLTGAVPGLMGNRHPSIAPYEVFATADRPIAVAAPNDAIFGRLAHALGRPDLLTDPCFGDNAARVEERVRLRTEVEEALAVRGADEWYAVLSAAGVPCGPINDVGQAFVLAERLGLDPVVEVEGVPQVANPVRLSRTPVTYRAAPPRRAGSSGQASPVTGTGAEEAEDADAASL